MNIGSSHTLVPLAAGGLLVPFWHLKCFQRDRQKSGFSEASP